MKKLLLISCLLFAGLETYSLAQQLQTVKEGISFLAIGDFGRHGAFTQKEVARDMGVIAEILEPNFILSVGDNFYPNGVQSTQDYQWFSSFENIYTHHLLHEPWYVALGNHDYEGSVQVQLDYTNVSRRWEMPRRYFEKLIEVSKGQYLQLLVIDTNPFVSKYHQDKEKYFGIDKENTQAQLSWLKEKLNKKNESIKWRIVLGHHPLYSGGKRKTEKETYEIKEVFEPIFQQAKIDAYICGHEHDLQIIQPENKSFVQYLSGAGSELRPTGKTDGTIYAESVPGFMAFTLTNDELTVYVIQSNEKNYEVRFKNTVKK